MNIALAVLTAVGFGITAWGLIAAYGSGKRELTAADKRLAESRALADEEAAEMAARTKPETHAATQAIIDKYERLYAERDLVRASYDNLVYLPAFETKRLLRLLLESTQSNLLWAGFGLLLSTVASIWSLLL